MNLRQRTARTVFLESSATMTQTHIPAALTATPQPRPFVELRQSLSSRADISPVVDQFMRFIKMLLKHRACSADGIEMDIHGNRENPHKRVHVTCRCSLDGEVAFTIRDEGQGFDPETMPDPTEQSNLLQTHGRGIWLMHSLMDEVTFQQSGRVVCMRKRLGTSAEKSSGHRLG
jgi:hypothetical protein